MTTGAHGVEVANSFARRRGDDVLVRLHLPGVESLRQPTLRLRRVSKGAGRRHDQRAEVRPADGGVLVEASVPAAAVTPGLWQLKLRDDGEESFRRVRARLLVKPHRPVALLTGPVPDTRMPPPRPRRPQASPPPTSTIAGLRARLRDAGGRLRRSR